MDDDPADSDDQLWLAQLLDRLGPDVAYAIADLLGLDLDEEDPDP